MSKDAFDAATIERLVPLQRAGKPEDVAAAVASRATPRATSPGVVPVNGGMRNRFHTSNGIRTTDSSTSRV